MSTEFGKDMITKTLKKHWGIIPMVVAVSIGCGGAMIYSLYAAATKTDVRWNKRSGIPPSEKIRPTDKNKFFVVHQEYKAIEELEKLRREIGPSK